MSRDRGVRAEHSKYGARITMSACPFCGALQDGATSLQEPETPIQPDPGDYSICITCGKMVVFDDQLRKRKPTPDEEMDIAFNPEVRAVLIAWRRMHAHRGDL